jgi:hypothetical protein
LGVASWNVHFLLGHFGPFLSTVFATVEDLVRYESLFRIVRWSIFGSTTTLSYPSGLGRG